tara:strand:+ start:1123 stop:1287 length:165 start_codon:yes stop_codon:yes gene_type:complete
MSKNTHITVTKETNWRSLMDLSEHSGFTGEEFPVIMMFSKFLKRLLYDPQCYHG